MAKTILIVDDTRSILAVMKTVLKVAGYNTLTASDGVEGMAVLNSGQHIDLIITDLNMPNMDGIEFIWEIRKLDEHAYTPICMLTTENEQERLEDGETVSTDAWITKPIQPNRVLNIVNKILPA